MKKATILFLTVILLFAFISISFAAEATKAEQMPTEKSKVKQITGEIITLDLKAGTLTVKSKRQEVSLLTDNKTIIRLGKEKKTLADIKSGEKVKVRYMEVDGKNVAKSIAIKPVIAAGASETNKATR
jgi:Cu/Ag efflux protein CusF